jgi:hypothetical protein
MNEHLASSRGLELDHAIRDRCKMRRDQLNECRLGRILAKIRYSAKPLFQLHIIQPKRMSNRIQTMLPSQFHASLPKRFRQLRPSRLGAAKLIQLALKLNDWLGGGGCDFAVQYQPTSSTDSI